MKENSQKKYNIGLDIGTSSVGWAVTDERYKLLKIHSKNMWGVRLFESAQTAQDRRVSRSARRRYNKRRERIRLLRMLMQDMIDEVDESFFVRMANLSFLNQEDKILESQNRGILYKDGYNLFIDKDYNDVTYYEQFKTIYHLRDYLCETKEKVDPRLIYLALHHIVKYRGNFLCEGQTYSFDNSNICNKISNCIEECLSMNNISILIDDDVVDKVIEILKTVKTKSSKVDELLPLFTFNKEDKQIFVQLMNSLVGKTFSVTKMFPNDEIKNDEKEIKLQFSDSKYDENIEKYSNDIGEKVEIIDRLKEIYSWVELNLILGDSEEGDRISISKAMIKRYENHKSDLKLLKKVIKEEFPDQYYNVFRNEDKKIHNYYNYINRSKDTSTEEFYNYIKKIINSKMSNDIQLIIDKMELETFLLKQNDRANSSIPYQLNKNEMELIIDNQAPYYPILLDNKEKLLSILEFRIPYYYGPLNPNGKFGWIIKNNNERILPWNHEEVVDVQATAEEFIKRLTNFCTYFPDEPVLPKYSLITSKYEVLAELNKITVNGHFLAIDTKRRILNDLFMTKKTVTDTHLRKWLKENQEELNAQDAEIKGYQKENTFSTSLTPWIDFVKIFGEINENNFEIIEKIIYDLTIFEDKKIIEKRLKNLNINLSQKQIKKILSLNYKGWSRLSKKLLFDIRSNYNGNVGLNIIEVMEMSNMALMEIINDKRLNFKKQIENVNNQEIQGKFKHEEVNKLAGSPALKKGIWQSLLIVEEIKKIMKCDPQNIFIEMAREEGKKERTTTAINKLQRLYQTIELETQENEVYKQLKKENGLSKIDSEKLKLYYMQLGKCMYTGKPLKIDELYLYQVDHIVPQSIIKDDSIDNKVLVYTLENQRKLDDLVVPFEIRKKMVGFWERLHESQLISDKKFYSLIKTEYREKDQERFINRQLVETRQITKNVARILKNHLTETNIMTVRANLTHDFRIKYDIYKNRNVNDYHHAHDAYICCVIGEYIKLRFPKLESKYIYGEFIKCSKDKTLLSSKDGFVLNSMNNISADENGEVIWDPREIYKIKKCFYYKDCFVTKKLEEKSGTFYKMTINSNDVHSENGKTKATLSVNKNRKDVHKYGGFEGVQYIPVAIKGVQRGKKKNKEVNKVARLPLVYSNWSIQRKEEYIKESEKLDSVRIIKELKINQLIEMEGGLYYISSPSELVNAKQLLLNEYETGIVYKVNSAVLRNDYSNISDDMVMNMYMSLIKKMKDNYPMFSDAVNKFMAGEEQFSKFKKEIQCDIINQMLFITQATSANGKIQIPGFYVNKRIGRLNNKTICLDDTYFYDQSVTGIYSKKYKL